MFAAEKVVYFIEDIVYQFSSISLPFTVLMVLDVIISFAVYLIGGFVSGKIIKVRIIKNGYVLAALYLVFILLQRYLANYGLPVWYEISLAIAVISGILVGTFIANITTHQS